MDDDKTMFDVKICIKPPCINTEKPEITYKIVLLFSYLFDNDKSQTNDLKNIAYYSDFLIIDIKYFSQ